MRQSFNNTLATHGHHTACHRRPTEPRPFTGGCGGLEKLPHPGEQRRRASARCLGVPPSRFPLLDTASAADHGRVWCRGGGSSLVPAAPSEGTPDVRVGRRWHGNIGRAEMRIPGRLACGLRPLADGSAHKLCHTFPRGCGGPFPPRLLLSSHPNGECFTHVNSVTHALPAVKAALASLRQGDIPQGPGTEHPAVEQGSGGDPKGAPREFGQPLGPVALENRRSVHFNTAQFRGSY
jgi:hypothetical protein